MALRRKREQGMLKANIRTSIWFVLSSLIMFLCKDTAETSKVKMSFIITCRERNIRWQSHHMPFGLEPFFY